jgi:hypothetical protein
MKNEKVREALWNREIIARIGDDKASEIIFEQYKLYIEMADKVSSRRDVANTFFLTLNGLIVSMVPVIVEKGIEYQNKNFLWFPFVVLSLQLFVWWRLILSYKQLNGAKFQIVGLMEDQLPARPYGKVEWECLLEKGENRKVYWPLSHLELILPWIFFIGYLIVLLSIYLSAK